VRPVSALAGSLHARGGEVSGVSNPAGEAGCQGHEGQMALMTLAPNHQWRRQFPLAPFALRAPAERDRPDPYALPNHPAAHAF
jgi:hypothetical protein